MSIFIQANSAATVSGVVGEYHKEEFLRLHNYFRRAVVPSSSNMMKMEWDDNLAAIAKKNAETCVAEHTKSKQFYENLYAGPTNNITTIMMYYFMERDNYDYYNPTKCPFKKCGHYEIIVNANMKYVGCAITNKRCGSLNYYHSFCMYKKLRVGWTTKLYEAGPPCTNCDNSHSFCDKGLCVQSKEQGTCERTCKNCGYFYEGNCRCYCDMEHMKAPDCSVRTPVEGFQPKSCSPCSSSPSIRSFCLNGGSSLPSNCSTCQCVNSFSGDRCQYKTAEINAGVMLTFHWSTTQFGRQFTHYPMNVRQGSEILNGIRNIIVANVKDTCTKLIQPSDIKIATGYPLITIKGELKMVIYVSGISCGSSTRSNNQMISQTDLLAVLNKSYCAINAAATSSHGTPLSKISVA